MNTRWIYFVIATIVAVLFTSNYFMVQSSTEVDCVRALDDCECRVTLENEASLKRSANPSCSIDDLFSGALKTCSIIKVGTFIDDIVRCNRGVRAVLQCGPKGIRQIVSGGSSIRLSCFSNSSTIKTTNSKGDWVNIGTSRSNGVFKLAWNRLAVFLGIEDEPRHTMVTETERVTIINGDGGFLTENRSPAFMLTAGEAIVESFCDGSITRLQAPAVVSLTRYLGNIDPTTGVPIDYKFQPCVANEMTGRWYGFYNPGTGENVPITIDLRQEPFTLETPNGVYSVMPFSINSDRVTIEAVAQTGTGTLRLEGAFDKGVLNFQFTEESVRENSRRFGKGSAQRLYIAQWAVAPASIDTPYNHPLLALTPATGALTWSIVSGNLPAGIALDGINGVLSGTPTAEGAFDFTVEVRDANGDSYKQSLTLNVSKLVVNTLFLPQAIPNREYRFNIEVSGGAAPYTFNDLSFPFKLPGLPPMPKMSPEGEISFTPEYTGGVAFFEVADSRGLKQFVTIPIHTRKLLIEGSAFLPSAGVGQSFNFEFKTAGQQGAVVWEADPQVLQETGLSLDAETGELSGTAPNMGVYSFWVTASDDTSSMTRQFTLTVDTTLAEPGPGISSLSRTNAAGGGPRLIPTFSAAGLVNGSSFAGLPPAGASIASLFGANLASGLNKTSTVPLPTTLGGTTVRLNNIPAPLFSVSPGQVNFQVPVELIGRTAVTMTVTTGGITSAPVSVSLSPFAPGIFTTNSQGTGQGAIVLANTVIVAAPEGSIPGRGTQPAKRGGFITIFCTGLGDVTSRPASGAAATGNPLAHTLATPIVTVGGVSAPVIFSGLAPGFVGLYQINVQLPAAAPIGPAVPVSVSIGGAVANTVTIAVQ